MVTAPRRNGPDGRRRVQNDPMNGANIAVMSAMPTRLPAKVSRTARRASRLSKCVTVRQARSPASRLRSIRPALLPCQ
jgi:hypothetical protein